MLPFHLRLISWLVFFGVLYFVRWALIGLLALFGWRYKPRPIKRGYPFVKRVAASLTTLWIFNFFRKGE